MPIVYLCFQVLYRKKKNCKTTNNILLLQHCQGTRVHYSPKVIYLLEWSGASTNTISYVLIWWAALAATRVQWLIHYNNSATDEVVETNRTCQEIIQWLSGRFMYRANNILIDSRYSLMSSLEHHTSYPIVWRIL